MARVVYGGSFNPPHIGHCRLVLEIWESMQHVIDGVDVVPCAHPPHKNGAGLLPFDLRAEMLESCMEELGFVNVLRMEGEREGPSYTFDTLSSYREANPGEIVHFLLGSHDFMEIPTWHRWHELPALCQFLIVPRGRSGVSGEAFVAQTLHDWPGAREESCHALHGMPGARCVRLADDSAGAGVGLVHYLPLPWLDISASQVRQLWLDGWHVDYLVPDAVRELLSRNSQQAHESWDRA